MPVNLVEASSYASINANGCNHAIELKLRMKDELYYECILIVNHHLTKLESDECSIVYESIPKSSCDHLKHRHVTTLMPFKHL